MRPAVGFEFGREGRDRFWDLTSKNVNRPLAIVLDGKVVSTPVIRGPIGDRGIIEGGMTTVGGIGHTLPFLIPQCQLAMIVAVAVVLIELATISWIRHRYMETPPLTAAIQVGLGGALVFATGLLIGSLLVSHTGAPVWNARAEVCIFDRTCAGVSAGLAESMSDAMPAT